MEPQIPASELTMDPNSLYREEVFSDQRVGSMRRLTPVDTLGNDDPSRKVIYVGQAQLTTPMGNLPIAFEIEADTLGAAAEGFAAAAEAAIERTAREIEEMRREQASQIVVPKAGGGIPGGGIQMP